MKKVQNFMFKLARSLLAPPGKTHQEHHSIYALMPNGPMKTGSIGLYLYIELLKAYEADYEDKVDKEAILGAITANYAYECEHAWQAFLAEIGSDND